VGGDAAAKPPREGLGVSLDDDVHLARLDAKQGVTHEAADNRRAGVREGQHCGAIGTAREGVEHDIGAKVNDSEHRLSLGSTR
jgi:hypothetical protein